jgi:hypothetical protein
MNYYYLYNCLRKDLTNFAFLRHSKFSGFLVSMHQSGTHWLKHMLATAISHKLHIPPPKYNHANDIIGGPKDPKYYIETPFLASSHSIPNPVINTKAIRKLIDLPRYVILIRDIRVSLVSNYEKWKMNYNCEFSEYLKGDIRGKRFNSDIWWCIRFKNRWGRIAKKFPEEVLIVKYEYLLSDTLNQLIRINQFWDLEISEASLQYGIDESSKEKMIKKDDPARPDGAVRQHEKRQEIIFSSEDNEIFKIICAEYLHYDFGYEYYR